jgi:hypothetical protein
MLEGARTRQPSIFPEGPQEKVVATLIQDPSISTDNGLNETIKCRTADRNHLTRVHATPWTSQTHTRFLKY